MLARHVQEAESVIASVRQAAAALFEIPAMPVGEGELFVMAREPFWVTQKWDETIGSFAGGALDKMLPASVRTARIRNRVAAQVDHLVQRNVENLRWATLQNIDDAFRRFSNWFDERLAETVDATRGAIETALEQRRQHAEAAKAALSELRRAAECVAAVKLELPASPELAPAAMRTGDIIFTERE